MARGQQQQRRGRSRRNDPLNALANAAFATAFSEVPLEPPPPPNGAEEVVEPAPLDQDSGGSGKVPAQEPDWNLTGLL